MVCFINFADDTTYSCDTNLVSLVYNLDFWKTAKFKSRENINFYLEFKFCIIAMLN